MCPPADSSLGGYGILPYPRRLLWDILPQNTPNSQNLLLRCSPTEFTEYTEFGSVGMAGMPYPPNLCSSVGGSSLPEVSVRSVHSVGISFLPQNSQNTQNLAAWVWQECHTLLHLCASVSSVGGSSLQGVLCIPCIPWELLHRLFGWCSRDCCTPWRNPQK